MFYSVKVLNIFIILFEISLSPYGQCAVSKVVGGIAALEDEFPFVVSLQNAFSRTHFCGGVVLDVSHVLTACHCCGMFRGQRFNTWSPKTIVVVGGDVNCHKGQMRTVLRLTIHKKCGELDLGWTYDYCLLTLAQRFLLGTTLKSIPLVSQDIDRQKEIVYNFGSKIDCWAVGWGHQTINSYRYYDNSSEVLNKLNVVLISREECEHRLCTARKTRCVRNLREREQFCAIGRAGDVCSGDSGGPVVCNGFVYGLVSWGPACSELPYPSVFSVISEGLRWPYTAWLVIMNKGDSVHTYSTSSILLPLCVVYFRIN